MKNILKIFQEYAFKNNHNISELFNTIINAHVIAQRCGTDLEHLDQYANEKALVGESKKALVRKLINEIDFLPHKLNIDFRISRIVKKQTYSAKINELSR